MKIAICSGGFDPLHSGHIAQFEAARALADQLVVAINSDSWLARKKGRSFMPIDERVAIVKNLKMVDDVIYHYDDNDGTSIAALQAARTRWPAAELIFCNGGDRTAENIPEMSVEGVRFEFGVGGINKMNSSSWILQEWKAPKTVRPWGYYRVLHEEPGIKVKEITVDPGAALSMQRHQGRSEFWLVASGEATVNGLDCSTDIEKIGEYQRHQYLHIDANQWHQLSNEQTRPLKIIEIQYGERCEEDDIERKFSNY